MNKLIAFLFLSSLFLLDGCAAANRPPDLITQSGYVLVDSDSVYYEARGNGRPVVLVHGGFVDRRMWDRQFDAFACCFRVIRYDLRGFGRSSMPKAPYNAVEDLKRLLDHLDIERAHLVGLSMGGGIAIDFTVTHAERVSALVAVASAPNGMDVPAEDVRRISELFQIGAQQGAAAAVEKWLQHPMLAATMSNPLSRAAMRTLSEENARFFTIRFWPTLPIEPRAIGRLEQVRTPTLVVEGEADTPLNRRGSQLLASRVPGARHVLIWGAAHMIPMEMPEQFNPAVLEFLQAVR